METNHSKTVKNKAWFKHARIALRFYLKNVVLGLGISIVAFVTGVVGVLLTQNENKFLLPFYVTMIVLNLLTLPIQGKWMKQSVEKEEKYG